MGRHFLYHCKKTKMNDENKIIQRLSAIYGGDMGKMLEAIRFFKINGFLPKWSNVADAVTNMCNTADSLVGRESHDALIDNIRSGPAPLYDYGQTLLKEYPSSTSSGGGDFSGSGASSSWSVDIGNPGPYDYVENIPLLDRMTFSDAYSAARRAGIGEFEFDGRTYSTDYDPNATLGPVQMGESLVGNLRNVYDADGRIIRDSTRVEPWMGQIPGRHKREHAQGGTLLLPYNKFEDGGDEDLRQNGDIEPARIIGYAPSINTAQGRKAAKNIAKEIASGKAVESIPTKYHDYIFGELNGTYSYPRMINRASDVSTSRLTDEEKRLRAEMIARYSGGIKNIGDLLVTSSKPVAAFRTWLIDPFKDRRVYLGKVTPKKAMERKLSKTNYTGVGNYSTLMNPEVPSWNILQVSDYTSGFEDDFVSAIFNGRTPLAEEGVEPISSENVPLYERIYGKTSPSVFGRNGLRGYQIGKETLDIAPKLDSVALSSQIYPTGVDGYDINNMWPWRIGDGGHYYDAGAYDKIDVEYGGKKYSKFMDVFDLGNNGGKNRKAMEISTFLDSMSYPYVVVTPWFEAHD